MWPDLTLSAWEDTRDTLQLWTQVVGKVRLALEPMVNHWWQVPLYVSARGLTTSLMHDGERGLEIEFDFVDHKLDLRTSDGGIRSVPLEPRSVARFYAETMTALDDLGVHVRILARPVEITEAIPFAQDHKHSAYDPAAAQRFWLALLQAHRVMTRFRGRFVGKASPVHFFWGTFDLALTRYSGRLVEPLPGAISHFGSDAEMICAGWWPGDHRLASPAFFSYAYPAPDGIDQVRVQPDAAAWTSTAGEFLFPYDAALSTEDPSRAIREFLATTYEGAAKRMGWSGELTALVEPTSLSNDGDPRSST